MSWIAVGVVTGSAVIGGAVGSMSTSKGKGGKVEMIDTRTPEQKAVDKSSADWITKYTPSFAPGTPYSGKLSAGMNGFETAGMGFLQNYLTDASATNANPMLGLAENEITKTLTGDYDPSTSQFYKATRDAAMTERQDALNTQNQGLGARNKYFSSEALNEGQQLNTRTTNFLQQTLGAMSEKERMNRLNAVPMAQSLDKARTAAQIAPIAAATTFGAIPRELEQKDYERQYQAWLNQRTEMAMPIQAAKGFNAGDFKTVGTNPAPTFNWGSFLGQIGSAAVTAAIA